jgi:hypothetical protein
MPKPKRNPEDRRAEAEVNKSIVALSEAVYCLNKLKREELSSPLSVMRANIVYLRNKEWPQ